MYSTTISLYTFIDILYLLLKLIVILFLESEKLGFDKMQFEYQASTTMCCWKATAVIKYLNRNGFPLYSAAMDMSMTNPFKTLLSKNGEPIYSSGGCCLFTITVNVMLSGVNSTLPFSLSGMVGGKELSAQHLFLLFTSTNCWC